MLADAEEQTVGRLDRYEARWLPIVRKYDGMQVGEGRAGGWLAGCLCRRAGRQARSVEPGEAQTALMPPAPTRIHQLNCRCANLDAQIITRLPADGAGGLAVARYFLYGQGNLTSALQAALDVPALQRHIEDTRAELLQVLAAVLGMG